MRDMRKRLPINVRHDAPKRLKTKIFLAITPALRAVLVVLEQYSSLHIAQMARLLRISYHAAFNRILRLWDFGVLKHIGPGTYALKGYHENVEAA